MQWSPRIGEVVALGAIGLALAASTLGLDAGGRVLVGAAALLVLALAVRDGVLRPRLVTEEDGLTARTLSGRTTIPWSALQVRLRVSRRWGFATRTLELEDSSDDAVLLVLGRRDLGADPVGVADHLKRLSAAGRAR